MRVVRHLLVPPTQPAKRASLVAAWDRRGRQERGMRAGAALAALPAAQRPVHLRVCARASAPVSACEVL
eukprot:349956-Chlamydomonas_euryale.AAC.5